MLVGGADVAVVARGLVEGPFPVVWDVRWVLDVFLVACTFADPGFIPLVAVLRIIRILSYADRFPSLISLNEMYLLVKESYLVILSIIGIMVMCGIFVAMFLNNLIVDLTSYSRLPRFLPADADFFRQQDFTKFMMT